MRRAIRGGWPSTCFTRWRAPCGAPTTWSECRLLRCCRAVTCCSRACPAPARRCSRSRWRPRSGAGSAGCSARPTCCPPTSPAHSVYSPATGSVGVPARPDLRQRRARRRSQSRVAADAGRAARTDGGAPSHDRQRDAPAAGAVLPRRDREPVRQRRDVPVARESARPVRAGVHRSAGRRAPPSARSSSGGGGSTRSTPSSRSPPRRADRDDRCRSPRALRELGPRLRPRRRRRDARPSRKSRSGRRRGRVSDCSMPRRRTRP